MEETTIVTENDGFVIQNLTRFNATDKIGITFVKTNLISADKSDIIVYNGPIIFKPNETIASLFTHIKQDDIVEPDEKFSYSFKTFATRSKRSHPEGIVTIGSSSEYSNFAMFDIFFHGRSLKK